MTTNRTDGPAFPVYGDPRCLPTGMTQRMYIATAAMQTLLNGASAPPEQTEELMALVAKTAYLVADAMLKEEYTT